MKAAEEKTITQSTLDSIMDAAWTYQAIADLQERESKAWACGYIDDEAQEAIDEAAGRDLGKEADAALAMFKSRILAAIRDSLPSGIESIIDRDGCASTYYSLRLPGRACVDFRISNHPPKYSGMAWYFDVSDSPASIRRGIEQVIAAVMAASVVYE